MGFDNSLPVRVSVLRCRYDRSRGLNGYFGPGVICEGRGKVNIPDKDNSIGNAARRSLIESGLLTIFSTNHEHSSEISRGI